MPFYRPLLAWNDQAYPFAAWPPLEEDDNKEGMIRCLIWLNLKRKGFNQVSGIDDLSNDAPDLEVNPDTGVFKNVEILTQDHITSVRICMDFLRPKLNDVGKILFSHTTEWFDRNRNICLLLYSSIPVLHDYFSLIEFRTDHGNSYVIALYRGVADQSVVIFDPFQGTYNILNRGKLADTLMLYGGYEDVQIRWADIYPKDLEKMLYI
jgi:hypothetical protein